MSSNLSFIEHSQKSLVLVFEYCGGFDISSGESVRECGGRVLVAVKWGVGERAAELLSVRLKILVTFI